MIPVGDAFLNTCMNFTRSKPATTDGVDDSEYKQQASEVQLGGGGGVGEAWTYDSGEQRVYFPARG